MKIQDITTLLENIAPPYLQESYDNCGLLTGNKNWNCTGILISLDATEAVIQEAIDKKCNLVVAHHPIIFSGLKKINGNNYVEKTIIAAIKNDIAIYAIHTNLDNVIMGVNGKMADMIGLINRQILLPKIGVLRKLQVFVPIAAAANLKQAIFVAGAGNIGKYSECSFSSAGKGTFKPGEGTNAFVGKKGDQHLEDEIKLEFIYPAWIENEVITAMLQSHPYEEVAYDLINLENKYQETGSGLLGELPVAVTEIEFLQLLKNNFKLEVVRHTSLTGKMVSKIALCGGAGSFLIKAAVASGADYYVTGDIKYHEFFDAEGKLVIADIGHYESEQFTVDLLFDILKKKCTTFAVLKTGVKTNPVQYFL